MVRVSLRQKIYQIIFGTDTPAGQYFDIALIYLILLSVLAIPWSTWHESIPHQNHCAIFLVFMAW